MQDFFRKSITPEYTDIQRVDRDRVRGIVEFATRDDLKRAIRDLDGAPRSSVQSPCLSRPHANTHLLHRRIVWQGLDASME